MTMASTVKTFRVFEMLCQGGPAKASVISSELELNKSSVHRFLNVLTEMGYVSQNETTGLYEATFKIHEMGIQVKNRIGIAGIAAPIMHRLQIEVSEGVNLGVLIDSEMAVIERVLPDANNTSIIVKARLPAYCTAIGKMLLACLDEDSLDRYLEEVELLAYTGRTAKNPGQLRVMLGEIRKEGVAIDDRELDDNLRSIAAPVRDDNGMVIAAMSVTGTVSRMVGDHFAMVQKSLLTAAADLSKVLGYQP